MIDLFALRFPLVVSPFVVAVMRDTVCRGQNDFGFAGYFVARAEIAVNYKKRLLRGIKIEGRNVSCVYRELVSGSVNLNSKPRRDRWMRQWSRLIGWRQPKSDLNSIGLHRGQTA